MHAGTVCQSRRNKHEKQQAIYSDCLPDRSAVSSTYTTTIAKLANSMQIPEGGGLECSRGVFKGWLPRNADPPTLHV